MFPKKLPPFGHGPRVFWAECPKASGTFRGPRSTVFRAAPPYSHLRERHCLYFSQKLPPFLLRRGCGGQVGLVIHSACATDDTFRGPRSTVFRAAPPYSHLRERHCLYFSQKLPPFLLRRGCGGQVGPVIHCACATDDTFRGPRSLKRSCPTLRIVLVSGVPCGSAVLTPSRKALFIVLQKAAPLRPRTSDRRGIVHISTISICHHLPVSL